MVLAVSSLSGVDKFHGNLLHCGFLFREPNKVYGLLLWPQHIISKMSSL